MKRKKSLGMVLCKINTHSLISEAKYICSARAQTLHAVLQFWAFSTMPSYPFFKGEGHLLGKDFEITERGRGTGNLQTCFRALYSKDRTEESFPKLEPGNFLTNIWQNHEKNI